MFLSNEILEKKTISIILLLSLTLHIIASFFSIGWYGADEQSCVLEYLNSKNGFESNRCFYNYQNEDLITVQKIRSWFQPYIYFIISKITYPLHLFDGFKLTFILRLFSSIIGFWSLVFFYNNTKDHFKNHYAKKTYFFLTFLFWFFPFIHARTSQESLSISFLFFSLALYIQIHNNLNFKKYLLLGFLLTITFILRYNLGIALFFIIVWDLFFTKKSIGSKILGYLLILFSGSILLTIELFINVWGYEETILNIKDLFNLIIPLNFLIYGNVNPNMSQEPFYWYFIKIITDFLPPTSILILISILFFWIKKPISIITFVTLPFFLVHSFIGHKELRYIFPILALSPYFISYFLDNLNNIISNKIFLRKTLYFLFAVNLFALIFISFSSQKNQLNILKKIVNDENINEIYFINDNDYIKKYESLNPFILKNITSNFYFHFHTIELKERINENNSKLIYSGFCRAGYSIGACVKKEQSKILDNKLFYKLKFVSEKELMIYLRNYKDFNLSEFNRIKLSNNSKEIFILTKNFNTLNQVKAIENCQIKYSNYPSFFSNISFNNINKRISYFSLFSCK